MPIAQQILGMPTDPNAETTFMAPIRATNLPDRYEVLGELGRGGMGIVYKARDRETGEVLAIKILKPEIAEDAAILERFKNELRLAHQITHRNVARLYEFHRSGECRLNRSYRLAMPLDEMGAGHALVVPATQMRE